MRDESSPRAEGVMENAIGMEPAHCIQMVLKDNSGQSDKRVNGSVKPGEGPRTACGNVKAGAVFVEDRPALLDAAAEAFESEAVDVVATLNQFGDDGKTGIEMAMGGQTEVDNCGHDANPSGILTEITRRSIQ